MNRNVITAVLMGFLFFYSDQIFAQRHNNRNRNRKVVVVNNRRPVAHPRVVVVHQYPRNRVVIVKQRNVRIVKVLPVGYTTISYGGRNYYNQGGYFYNYYGGNYTIIAAPIGLRSRVLPIGYRRIFIGGAPRYYYRGVYYKQVNNEYETIEPSVGTIVPELPDVNVDEVTIDGKPYYEYDNMLYKSVNTESGVQYEVVSKIKD